MEDNSRQGQLKDYKAHCACRRHDHAGEEAERHMGQLWVLCLDAGNLVNILAIDPGNGPLAGCLFYASDALEHPCDRGRPADSR